MLDIFGKFSFAIIASYISAISLISLLVLQTLISKIKTDREMRKREAENESN